MNTLLVPHFFLPITTTFNKKHALRVSRDQKKPNSENATELTSGNSNAQITTTPDQSPTREHSPTSVTNFRPPGRAPALHRLSMPPGGWPTATGVPLTPTGGGWFFYLPQFTEDDYFLPRNSPEPADNTEWSFSDRQGYSALYSGIASLKANQNVVQIGWIGRVYDEDGEVVPFSSIPSESLDSLRRALWEQKMVPVFLSDQVSSGAYEGFCKSELHPLLHYVLKEIEFNGLEEMRHWSAYQAANEAFAKVCLEHLEDGMELLIQDYHLCLLPQLIRKECSTSTCKIGLFLHTPFPSSEILRSCARRTELLEGILGADLIGFQTYAYARHFMSSCTRILSVESTGASVDVGDRLVKVSVFPIGIDVGRAIVNMRGPDVQQTMNTLKEMYKDKFVIVGRERLDQVEGVEHKLNAFSKFLEQFPQWQGRVVLIQVTTPPQRASPKLENKVSELVTRVNGKFGTVQWLPVHHFHQHIEQADYYALLQIADVCLITATRDGMNITSHEFVVCQQEKQGVLILSEFTGSASSLSSAIFINPYDYLQVAHALSEALEMSAEERKARHVQLLERVEKQTAQFWAKSCVNELRMLTQTDDFAGPTPLVRVANLVKDYLGAERRLIVLDYDGTLTRIQKVPSAAVPTSRMLAALTRLAQDERNVIFVVSGRDQATLDQWLGALPIGLSAEHGCFIKYPHSDEWLTLAQGDTAWKEEVMKIFQFYEERTQGSFIEQKRNAITWHFRLADADFGSHQAKEAQHHLEASITPRLPVSVLVGKKNLEVRPIGVNKGQVLKRLWAESDVKPDFVLTCGDDQTDEDTFRAAHQLEGLEGQSVCVYTVAIGDSAKKTKATSRLATPDALIQVLEQIVRAAESSTTA